jgi:predicted dienelactone hydrolase
MSTLRSIRCLVLSGVVLTTLSGCFFPSEGKAIAIPVFRDGAVERTLPVSLFYDLEQIRSQNDGQPAGLVVYSLGYSACTPSAHSLANMLAQRGYVFAVPNHNDIVAVCLCLPDTSGAVVVPDNGQLVDNPALQEFYNRDREKGVSEDQLEEFFYYRDADIFATVEHLTNTETYAFGSLKDKPVILVGYSIGGWNVLNVAGAGNLFPELHCNVTAIICQNTFVGELTEDRIQQISCPVFYLAGTSDILCPEIRNLFEWRPADSRMVEIVGADHYIFAVDLCSSPVLSALHPGSCEQCTLDAAQRVNELTVEFISALAATKEVPEIEELESYSPELFTVVH